MILRRAARVHSWAPDLVSPDDTVRARARRRHEDLIARANTAWRVSDWRRAGELEDSTVFGLLQVPEFTVLYLRWEVDFPDEWRARTSDTWSPWTRKQTVLHRLGKDGVPAEIHEPVADLLDAVLRRPYRCKDWIYAAVARHVPYRARLDALHDEQPLRAQFIRHVLDHPQLHVTRKTWGRWLVA